MYIITSSHHGYHHGNKPMYIYLANIKCCHNTKYNLNDYKILDCRISPRLV